MSIINLIVDGIEIAISSSHSITQKIEPIVAESIIRMSDGTAVKQTAWSGKVRISISGTGRLPLPLADIDYSQSFLLKCSSPLTARSATNTVAMPSSRRSDASPVGYAIVSGNSVRTAVSISSDTATLDAMPGATSYEVAYFPEYTVFSTFPSESDDSRSSGARSWSMVCEQV